MTMEIDPAAFVAPTLVPIERTHEDIRLARLGEDDYRAASFLDGRLFAEGAPARVVSWPALQGGAPDARPIHFIFHIGHCGSTLFSRLLGEHPAVFALREPGLLRDLARGELPSGATQTLLSLYGRVWRDGQTALIKATSFVSEIGEQLMTVGGGRALLLAVTPPAYLRGILAGENSRLEMQALAGTRRARLERRLGRQLSARGEGETIALAWLCEAASLQALADAFPRTTLQLDFDRGLADPKRWLALALEHLALDAGAVDLHALVAGPLMGHYAKAPEYAYDAQLRTEVLTAAGREHVAEFRAGMDWLQRQALADPRVARILSISAELSRRPLAPRPVAG